MARKTKEDKVFGKLYLAVEAGHLKKEDVDIRPISGAFNDLFVEDGVIMFGS